MSEEYSEGVGGREAEARGAPSGATPADVEARLTRDAPRALWCALTGDSVRPASKRHIDSFLTIIILEYLSHNY